MMADAYFKKEVALQWGGHVLRFRVSQDLFSSHEVDIGTRRLLRNLPSVEGGAPSRALDLGCGYGVLGLALKKQYPACSVHMVDRDALAVEYARQNAALNGLSDVAVYGSLGYDDLATDELDLILANIPAKAGIPVIAHLLQGAAHFLRPGGLVAVVVVSALEPLVAGLLAEPGVVVCWHKAWPGHTVFHYTFTHAPAGLPGPAFERGVYDWQDVTVASDGLSFPLRLVHGLPESDAFVRQTALLLEGLADLRGQVVRCALVLNPGQGHVPVALWHRFRPAEIVLVDRDLLSLRCARRNLLMNGCPPGQIVLRHQVGLEGDDVPPADLALGVLREEEGPAAVGLTIARLAGHLADGGSALLAAGSTAVTRAIDQARSTGELAVKRRKRSRGCSLLWLQRRTGPALPG